MSISRENILKLQNGSDVRGVAVGGVGEAAAVHDAESSRCFIDSEQASSFA